MQTYFQFEMKCQTLVLNSGMTSNSSNTKGVVFDRASLIRGNNATNEVVFVAEVYLCRK